jgi:hypothetical protein
MIWFQRLESVKLLVEEPRVVCFLQVLSEFFQLYCNVWRTVAGTKPLISYVERLLIYVCLNVVELVKLVGSDVFLASE